MPIAQSKVTAPDQVSGPTEIQKKLRVGPGSVLERDEQDDLTVIRRAGKFSSSDVHHAIFSDDLPRQKRLADVKTGIRKYITSGMRAADKASS